MQVKGTNTKGPYYFVQSLFLKFKERLKKRVIMCMLLIFYSDLEFKNDI